MSNITSSSLTRSRIALLTAATIFTGIATYGIYRRLAYEHERSSLPGTGLHRSNAVHRRRRRNTAGEAQAEEALDDHMLLDMFENVEGNTIGTTLEDGETVIDDGGVPEDLPWREVPNRPYQRHGQNIVQLLFRVSEDATRRNAYVHRGCACNSCGVVPIRGIRYRCANCADYDLCESCESQGMHIKTHIFYKVKVPAPSFGPRHIQPVWYSGDPDSALRILPKEVLTKLSRETGFERPELEAYWEQWTFMANTDWRDDPDDICLAMDRKTFERCLVPSGGYRHSAPSLIFDRMFAFYDTNKDDLIGFPEFLHGIAYRKKKDKWRQIFDGYDIDNDGFVDRKDFLRMFRSYYVLYRQMHRDMLEGMEEQQMSSTEAHRLVNSRQPLSSAFGQDGRYPRAPDPRTGEGKAARPDGDLDIVDGKGVINESSNDYGNREDVFRRDLSGMFNGHWDRTNNPAYWATLLNPPETLGDMPRVLNNFERNPHRHRDRLLAELLPQDTSVDRALQLARRNNEDSDSSYSYHDTDIGDENTIQEWPPTFINVTIEDVQAIAGTGVQVEDVQPVHRRAIIAQAIFREGAHKDVYERWQRRHFYTDEEEGAVPPEDWKEEDDILMNAGVVGESSKVSRPIHSRSSSKVRFAEDMDDFDTRSNPSTSSRSVPERWGGIEIPDAEKDAGKEILYQVTQQAFNELLDPLFKEKEDLAIECAATQTSRDQYRSMYTEADFVAWAEEKEAKDIKCEENITHDTETYATPIWPSFPEVELEEIREHPLEHLLAATGFEITVNDGQDMPALVPLEDIPTPDLTQSPQQLASDIPMGSESGRPESELLDPTPTPADLEGTTPTLEELPRPQDENEENQRPQSPTSTPSRATLPESDSTPETLKTCDPTMPQFRPNGPSIRFDNTHYYGELLFFTAPSGIEIFQAQRCLRKLFSGRTSFIDGTPEVERPMVHVQHYPTGLMIGRSYVEITIFSPVTEKEIQALTKALMFLIEDMALPSKEEANHAGLPHPEYQSGPPEKEQLYQLWLVEKAVQEADARGGWGKLNFEEFESLVKRFVREGKGNQMDYLGSWIEFCIP